MSEETTLGDITAGQELSIVETPIASQSPNVLVPEADVQNQGKTPIYRRPDGSHRNERYLDTINGEDYYMRI